MLDIAELALDHREPLEIMADSVFFGDPDATM
jgi:hypothetical protein